MSEDKCEDCCSQQQQLFCDPCIAARSQKTKSTFAAYVSKVDALQSFLDQARDWLSRHDDDLESLEDDVESVTGDLACLDNEVSHISKRVNALELTVKYLLRIQKQECHTDMEDPDTQGEPLAVLRKSK